MNFSTAVMLINKKIRAVKIAYDALETHPNQQHYIFKTLDQSIKKGDFVVIPTDTRHKMTVVLVTDVDVDVDYDSPTAVKWIISKVDVAASVAVLAEEAKWIDAIRASEKRKKAEEMTKNLKDMYSDAGLETLAISTMSDIPVIEHKKE